MIQYVSDIHLEFHDKHNTGSLQPSIFVDPSAPYLVLAGDIGIPDLKSYKVFLQWCSTNWKGVFLIAGNHEFYNVRCPTKTTMQEKKRLIQEICSQFTNVHFLDCSSVYLPEENLRILGCTLWTDIPDDIADKAAVHMNETRQVLDCDDTPLYPWRISEIHRLEKQWLEQEIQKCEGNQENCLVITHHLPSYSLIHEKYAGSPLNCCFASHSEDLFRLPVVGWICGHTHTGMKLNIQGIPCVINPVGYPGETVETKDRNALLHL